MRGSAVYASRGCPQDVFPSSFIYFSYLLIHLSVGSSIGRAAWARAVLISCFVSPPLHFSGIPNRLCVIGSESC